MKANLKLLILLLPICAVYALEPNYTLPAITYTTLEQERQQARERGRRLMELKGIMEGDGSLVCTNWLCPTSIVVNAVRYDVVTNWWDGVLEFVIATTNVPPEKIAAGTVHVETSSREARLSAFTTRSYTSMFLDNYARNLYVQPVDSLSNMMFVASVYDAPTDTRQLVYKNIRLQYEVINCFTNTVATNALAFAAAIINAGLPENERIPLPPAP